MSPLGRLLASGFGTGFSPFAPGTAGTLAAVPFAWALSHLSGATRVALLLAFLPVAAALCGAAARSDGRKDPSWVVLDEMVGYWVAVVAFSPRISAYLAAFLLFRLFDIVKPPPAGRIDRAMPGGWGILLDDVVAGLYAGVFLLLLRGLGAV